MGRTEGGVGKEGEREEEGRGEGLGMKRDSREGGEEGRDEKVLKKGGDTQLKSHWSWLCFSSFTSCANALKSSLEQALFRNACCYRVLIGAEKRDRVRRKGKGGKRERDRKRYRGERY